MMTYEEYQEFLREQFAAPGGDTLKKTAIRTEKSFLSSPA
jgi:hypothetical protein